MAETQVKKKAGKDLTEGPVFPLLISFAVPMVLSSMVQQLYSMVDLMVIGQYVGSVGTVAVSTGGELSDLMTPLASALAQAGQIYIAQLVGAKDDTKVKSVVQTLITLMLFISFAIAILAFIFSDQFLMALSCPEEAFSAARQYLLITALGMPFIFGYNVICAILRAMGESKRPLIFILVAATINIFLDLLFVVVFRWDAVGTALATVASQIGACAASFIYLYRIRDQVGLVVHPSYLHVDFNDCRILLRLGIPQLVRVIFVQGSTLWVKSSVNSYGLVASATYSVGNKVEKFMNLFIQGLDGAGGSMIGQNLGARKTDRVKTIVIEMLAVSLAMGIIVAILFLLFPKQFYSVFTNDPEVMEYGVTYLRIMAIGCIVVAFSAAMKPIATGAGAAMLSLAIGMLDGITRVLACLIAFNIFHQGAESYFWGGAMCQLVPGIVCMIYLLSGRWKTKKLLSET